MSLEHSAPDPSYTVDEFCKAERLSRGSLYGLWRIGKGPRYYRNGTRRIITHRARLELQLEREREAEAEAAS